MMRSCAVLAAVLVVVATVVPSEAVGDSMKLFLLENDAGTKCLDGTPSGYYYAESPSGNTDDWVVFLEGGGACETIPGCIARSKTALGSSKYWAPTRATSNDLMASNCSFNPFCDFNHVFVPYCSGDVYVGMETKADPLGLQFSGHLTVHGVIADLQSKFGLGSKSNGTQQRLLLAGSSAGGIGTFVNADYVASMLPSVNVRANPQGGFFFPNITAYPYWMAHDFHYPENNTEIDVFDAYLNPDCVADHGETALCNDLFFLYPYLKTEMFVAENQYDANQLYRQLHVPQQNTSEVRAYLTYYGNEMRRSLSQIASPNGLYAPSCVCHTSNLNMEASPIVDGYTLSNALKAWYFEGTDVVVMESCPNGDTLPCNQDCKCH